MSSVTPLEYRDWLHIRLEKLQNFYIRESRCREALDAVLEELTGNQVRGSGMPTGNLVEAFFSRIPEINPSKYKTFLYEKLHFLARQRVKISEYEEWLNAQLSFLEEDLLREEAEAFRFFVDAVGEDLDEEALLEEALLEEVLKSMSIAFG